jgi:hypothetical protein
MVRGLLDEWNARLPVRRHSQSVSVRRPKQREPDRDSCWRRGQVPGVRRRLLGPVRHERERVRMGGFVRSILRRERWLPHTRWQPIELGKYCANDPLQLIWCRRLDAVARNRQAGSAERVHRDSVLLRSLVFPQRLTAGSIQSESRDGKQPRFLRAITDRTVCIEMWRALCMCASPAPVVTAPRGAVARCCDRFTAKATERRACPRTYGHSLVRGGQQLMTSSVGG